MAKVIPTAGFRLVGKLGGVVFCCRGDELYARTWVQPKDPKTRAQKRQRLRMRVAVGAWRALSEEEKAVYRKRASFLGRTGYHLFISEYVKTMK